MAKTAFATDNALTKKLWEEKLFRDTEKDSYFSRFMGSNAESIVQTNAKLEKSQGDKVTFGIRMRLTGSGITAGQVLEGNEEKLVTHDFSVTLQQYRHAVRDNGAMDRKRAMFSIDEESESALKTWGAEKIDKLCFDTITASPTKAFYGGSASSTATLTTSDKLTPSLISKAKTWALGGGNRAQTPLRPVRVNGKNHFVLLVHPDVMYDIKQDSTFSQALREAEVRGKENPLFNGSVAIWDGVVIHEHENAPISTTYGSGANVPGAQCVLMGAQSLVWAWGKRPEVVSRDFDYGNEHGYAWGFIAATGKPKFNSLDYGSLAIYVARTQIN